jgi:hypothetical protein
MIAAEIGSNTIESGRSDGCIKIRTAKRRRGEEGIPGAGPLSTIEPVAERRLGSLASSSLVRFPMVDVESELARLPIGVEAALSSGVRLLINSFTVESSPKSDIRSFSIAGLRDRLEAIELIDPTLDRFTEGRP